MKTRWFKILLQIPHFPKHLLVAASAWGSRFIVAIAQLISIRFLMESLNIKEYAAFSILTGLSGWYSLSDLGIGISVQNYISECRAKKTPYDKYMITASALAVLVLMIMLFTLYFTSPYLSKFFLKSFPFISNLEKNKLIFTVGSLMIASSIGSISYKIWYAEHKGYFANILPALSAIISLVCIYFLSYTKIDQKLYLNLIAFIAPSGIIPLIALGWQIYKKTYLISALKWGDFNEIIKRANHFFWFSLMAAGVLQMDYLILSQVSGSYDIAVYNISTKIFASVLFIYGALLTALWPVLSEEIIQGNWKGVRVYLKKYLTIGLIFVIFSTILLIWLMPSAVTILAPGKKIIVPIMLILLLGIYHLLRVWTDTFAMVLQSMSDLRPLWLSVPFQAILSISLQWILSSFLGLDGIVLGLIMSFLLTVSWILPLAVRQREVRFVRSKS